MQRELVTYDEQGVRVNLLGGIRFRRIYMMPLYFLLEVLLIVVMLSFVGCQGSAPPTPDLGDLEMTLSAAAAATSAGVDMLMQTRQALQTAEARPTATVTPMGPVYDGGDGRLTTVFVNLPGTGLIGGGSVRQVLSTEAHNYLFDAQPGAYEIWVTARSGDPRFIVIDPSGQVVADVDNSDGALGGHVEVTLAAGIHTIRVSTNSEASYDLTLHQK